MVCYLILDSCQAVKLTDPQMTCVLQASSHTADNYDYQRWTATSKESESGKQNIDFDLHCK